MSQITNDLDEFRKRWMSELSHTDKPQIKNDVSQDDGKTKENESTSHVKSNLNLNTSLEKKVHTCTETTNAKFTSSPRKEYIEKRLVKRKAISDFWNNLTSQGQSDNGEPSNAKKQRTDSSEGDDNSIPQQKEKYLELFLSDLVGIWLL